MQQQIDSVLHADMDDMISVLDAFVVPGSELWLYNEASTPSVLHTAHANCMLCIKPTLTACAACIVIL